MEQCTPVAQPKDLVFIRIAFPDCVMCFEDEDDGFYNAVGL